MITKGIDLEELRLLTCGQDVEVIDKEIERIVEENARSRIEAFRRKMDDINHAMNYVKGKTEEEVWPGNPGKGSAEAELWLRNLGNGSARFRSPKEKTREPEIRVTFNTWPPKPLHRRS